MLCLIQYVTCYCFVIMSYLYYTCWRNSSHQKQAGVYLFQLFIYLFILITSNKTCNNKTRFEYLNQIL